MTSQSPDASLDGHLALQEWVTQHGGRLDETVQLARDDSRGVHIQVRPDRASAVPRGTCVITTPLPLTMSYFDAIDYTSLKDQSVENPFSSHGVKLPRGFIDAVGPQETTAFFLMGHYLKGRESFWYPYIRTLPPPGELTTPLYYEGEDLEWLQGTSLYAARQQRLEIWKDKYETDVRALKEWGFGDAERYTWDVYLWASTIIASRAFTAKVLAGVIGLSDLPEETISVLLPLIDVTNHRPLARVEWQAGNEKIGLAVMEDTAAGREIGNNYGPRGNEQLMMNYGFCISENLCDYRVVSLRAPPGSPLYEAKIQQKQAFPETGNKEDQYYVFNVSYPLLAPDTSLEHSIFSPDLFGAVSVLSANDREFETLEITKDGVRIPSAPYGNSRNILASLSQIIIELITHIVKLKSSGQSLQEPRNLKQAHAKIYRDSQVMLSETAIVVAEWTLARAGHQDTSALLPESYLSRIPTGKFSEEATARIKSKLTDSKSLLRKEGELFQFSEVFALLPQDIREPCRDCLRSILSHAKQFIAPSPPENASGPLGYAVLLCLLSSIYRSAGPSQLPPRLTRWFGVLLETYQPPPEDVSWVLPDEEDEEMLSAFDEIVETLRTRKPTLFSGISHLTGDWEGDAWWLSPNWLRWAWMLAEQEMVNAVDDPLQFVTSKSLGSGGPVALSTNPYLYVPQE
ncbi:SET domain protein [Paecilomyces variotii No. 5]|uniref:SET domain protein n=1 Tax=Byssochlamys spectabilis (strain No. 5 / NBRC 109023) TaxID=1356009 RepID=V5G0T1_BYSSN|nr:SET domain protein [Paecilomyces variotii No. 5]